MKQRSKQHKNEKYVKYVRRNLTNRVPLLNIWRHTTEDKHQWKVKENDEVQSRVQKINCNELVPTLTN